MTEHTPGPWQAVFDESGTWARVDGDMKNGGAYVVAEFDLMQASHHGEKAWLEEKANARLIAAAPDLLWLAENQDRYMALEEKRKVRADDYGGLASFEKEFVAKYDQRKQVAIATARGQE